MWGWERTKTNPSTASPGPKASPTACVALAPVFRRQPLCARRERGRRSSDHCRLMIELMGMPQGDARQLVRLGSRSAHRGKNGGRRCWSPPTCSPSPEAPATNARAASCPGSALCGAQRASRSVKNYASGVRQAAAQRALHGRRGGARALGRRAHFVRLSRIAGPPGWHSTGSLLRSSLTPDFSKYSSRSLEMNGLAGRFRQAARSLVSTARAHRPAWGLPVEGNKTKQPSREARPSARLSAAAGRTGCTGGCA